MGCCCIFITMSSTSTTNALNPFEWLGVTVNSTAEQVKQEFMARALRTHTDKVGGDHERMVKLLQAYKHVMSQVRAAKWGITMEDLEDDFAAFIAAQEANPRCEADFEELWARRDTQQPFMGASLGDGYEAAPMRWESGQACPEYADLAKDVSVGDSVGDSAAASRQLVQYTPVEALQQDTVWYDGISVSDFSLRIKRVSLHDFQDAFVLKELEPSLQKINMTLEELMSDREAFSAALAARPPEQVVLVAPEL